MELLVFTIILFFIAVGFLGFSVDNREDSCHKIYWRFNAKMFLSPLVFLLIFFGTYTRIPANSVGIVYSAFNGTSEQTLSEGFHSKSIFDTIYIINTEVCTTTVSNLTTQTKDAQYVNSILDIKYRVSENNAYLVFKQYRTLENMGQTLIVPTTQRMLELITTKYNVMDILGESRSDIYMQLESSLSEEFSKYGIDFYSISITDMDAGEQIENAITAEAVAKKAVETAEQELLKAQTDAQKLAVQAKAEQDAAKIEAETLVIKAQSEKEANELINVSLTPELLLQQMYAKWNGVLPTVCSDTSSFMLNLDSLSQKTTTPVSTVPVE